MSTIKRLPKQYIYAFLFTIIGGYIQHLYAFTNIVPNSDGINRVYDVQQMTVSGRWFLHYATMPSGFMQMPTFIGLLTLLFLGLSAMMMVDLLKINQPLLAGLFGLSFVSFPSLGFTFLYLFTASAYSIGVFLAVFSVWVSQKQKKYWIVAVLSLAFSMGIYQAYAPFAIGLSLILVLKKVLQKEEHFRSIAKYGLGKLAYLASGATAYYVILNLVLIISEQELLPYLGMENESYPFTALPSLILSCYKQVLIFFFLPQYASGTTTIPLAILHLSMMFSGLSALLSLLKPHWKTEPWRIAAALSLCAILPLAIGFVQIISPWSAPTPLMQYPYVLIYLLLLFFLDQVQIRTPSEKKNKLLTGILLQFILVSFCSGWICNLLYTASAQAHRATESYVTRLMSRVESAPGYSWDMPILIIGAFPEEKYYAQIEAYSIIDHYSAPQNSVLPLNKHIYYYLNHWLNIPVEEPSEASMIAMAESVNFQEMPCYPDDGSVRVIQGQVVVKVGETYSPKSDYELAYESSQK